MINLCWLTYHGKTHMFYRSDTKSCWNCYWNLMDLNVDQWVMSQWSQVTHDLRGPSRFVDPLTRWPSSAPPTLWDCVTTASSFGCQPSTDSSARSTGHIRWSGVRCRRSVDVQLTTETFTRPFKQHLRFWPSYQTFFLLRVLMYAAHKRLWRGCAI